MGQFHWDSDAYLELMRRELPDYERLQDELVDATRAVRARAILELGTGTGETARRVLGAHPRARLHGIDASADMLAVARAALDDRRASLAVGRLQEGLPRGPFHLVVSALAVHHLDADGKAELFARVAEILVAGGRFVLADVVVPSDPADAVMPIDPSIDLPSPVDDQVRWLREAGLRPSVAWTRRDLAVIVAQR
jgi:tRNA (cmo5U34)-methyltransferase